MKTLETSLKSFVKGGAPRYLARSGEHRLDRGAKISPRAPNILEKGRALRENNLEVFGTKIRKWLNEEEEGTSR